MSSAQAPALSQPKRVRLFGHPKGVFLVSFTEMWERFSYYGMAGILVFFLISAPSEGGFGWDKEAALKLFGIYSGLVFASPAIGGWISSRYWGERRSILVGGLAITSGHFLLAGPSFIPALASALTDVPVAQIIEQAGASLGQLTISDGAAEALRSEIADAIGNDRIASAWPVVSASVTAASYAFFVGLALIVIGTGFIKATVASIVGKLYDADDPRRDAGFTLFMVGIWFGSLVSNFVAGGIGAKYGWPMGLTVAGIGMAVGMASYLMFQNRLLGDIGKTPDAFARAESAKTPLSKVQCQRLFALALMSVFTLLYSMAFYQKGGLINLMIQERADRSVWGLTIPAPWFLSISTATFILTAPLLAQMLTRLELRGLRLDVVQKQAIGMAMIAIGYVFMTTAAFQPVSVEINPLFFVAGYIFFGIADAFIWPPQISAASRLAPAHMKSFVIGCWYIATGIGTFFSGYVAVAGYTIGIPTLFASILGICAASAVALLALRARLKVLMQETDISH